MKVGIKLWSSNKQEIIDQSGFADFVEVLPVDLKSISKFASKKYEYTTHVPHEYFGFYPSLRYEKTLKLVRLTLKAAKKLNSSWMVMHTGRIKGKATEEATTGAVKAVARLAKEANYSKMILENSIVSETHKGEKIRYFGYSYEQIKRLLEATNAGFCLDLEHAAIAAFQLGIDYKELVTSLLKLKPDYFHLSGAKLLEYGPKGHHISIFEGDLDRNFVREVLRKAKKPVCLETPIDIEQRKKEVEFLKS